MISDIEKSKQYASYLLSSKMYTCREIFQKLVLKGYSEEIAEETVSFFCINGILNDERYAEFYIHDAAGISFKGIYRIKQELAKKGIASNIIDKAIQNSGIDTADQLTEYVKLKYADTIFTSRRELEKAKAHLLRRGYGYSEINECFKELNIKVTGGDWD